MRDFRLYQDAAEMLIGSAFTPVGIPCIAKTIIYGLSSHTAFVLLYVDVNQEVVYYLPIQDYFISRPEMFKKLDTDQKTISIHIPLDNVVLENDFDLVQIAKSTYVDGPTSKLRKV